MGRTASDAVWKSRLGEEMMADLRNREDHAKTSLITEADADKMLKASKDVISLVHEDRVRLEAR